MKKIAIIAATLLAIVSCFDKEKYDYIPKDKKPNLQNGDTVYFVNHQDKSLVDTFVVQISTHYEVFDKTHYFEEITWEYKSENKSFFYTLSTVHGRYFGARHQESNYASYDHTITSEIDIQNIKFPVDVYVERDSSNGIMPNPVYYSIKKGIVRYDYSDTNYYEIKL
ncbi:MAG: hypothetical protein FWC39_13065 [Bacteroidetes bacterium]|nr:hypothetical protein [Bacteroidota bacterium]